MHLTLAVLLTAPAPLVACIWDSETLASEEARFPGVREMIAGYFPQHSEAFYEWRSADRSEIPVERRTAGDYDDLAVSYEKLGQHEKAIEVIREKIERFPEEGRYESEANLGTFLIHNGQFEEGLKHIQRAIEINPDAHFGREVYQQLLVEYVIHCGRPDKLPLQNQTSIDDKFYNFADFVKLRRPELKDDITPAVKGVMGMVRFGNADSPILMEALGDLLLQNGYDPDVDAKRLACRAYLRASMLVDDPEVEQAYRDLAAVAIEMQTDVTVEDVEAELRDELAAAKALSERIAEDEAQWIEGGEDVSERFTEKYLEQPLPNMDGSGQSIAEVAEALTGSTKAMALVGLAAVLAGCVVGWAFLRRKPRPGEL